MDKKTEELCKKGVDALVDIYTIILEDMGIHVEKETPQEDENHQQKRGREYD